MDRYSIIGKKFQIHTSDKELKDLLIAWILISVAFAIVRTSGEGMDVGRFLGAGFWIMVAISAFTVGVGFLFHELAHKIVAQKYRCWAEFRADIQMLMLALIMSFWGFVFIAPGAVMIFGNITKKQNGIISLAGPLTNLVIAILLLPLLFLNIQGIWKELVLSGYMINAWLGLFNMIPLWNFDGRKILSWNKIAYFGTLILASALVFIYFAFMIK